MHHSLTRGRAVVYSYVEPRGVIPFVEIIPAPLEKAEEPRFFIDACFKE